MKTFSSLTLAAIAFASLASTAAHACKPVGLGAQIASPFIGNKAACDLDKANANAKAAIPAWRVLDETAASAGRAAATGAALSLGGPAGLALGHVVLGQVNQGLQQLGQGYDSRQGPQDRSWDSNWQLTYCADRGFRGYDAQTNTCIFPSSSYQVTQNNGQAQQANNWLPYCNANGFRGYDPRAHTCF